MGECNCNCNCPGCTCRSRSRVASMSRRFNRIVSSRSATPRYYYGNNCQNGQCSPQQYQYVPQYNFYMNPSMMYRGSGGCSNGMCR